MSFSSDDLASVLLAPDREFAGYGQGILRSWDADTFNNQVEYRGTILTDLPVMSGTDALSFQAGDVVLLMKWKPTGKGLGSYWIAGRPVIPASGRAVEAIEFLTGTLALAVSAQVFASRMFLAEVSGLPGSSGSRNNVTYGALTGGGAGPVVEDVPISAAGKALVAVGCQIACTMAAGDWGYMSYSISGATSRSAVDENAYDMGVLGDPALFVALRGRAMAMSIQTGLNEGAHTFTSLYRTENTNGSVFFYNRSMLVIGF